MYLETTCLAHGLFLRMICNISLAALPELTLYMPGDISSDRLCIYCNLDPFSVSVTHISQLASS